MHPPGPASPDVIIIGGGIMGSALAYSLKTLDPGPGVVVIEPDPAYERASTTLSMANLRIQFSLAENIRISQYAFEVMERFSELTAVGDSRFDPAFRREGNLFLDAEKTRENRQKTLALQQSMGCRVEWKSPAEIKSAYPLYDTSTIAGGAFGPDDGHIDAYAVLTGFKKKAVSLGAVYIKDRAVRVLRAGDRVSGVRLESGSELRAPVVANCAGAWAAEVAETAGVKLPVMPVKRQVFAVDVAVKPEGPLPLTVLPSGLYFRTETGNLILVGKSMDSDPIGFDFTWSEDRFMEVLWPELAAFVPAFERLKLMRGWAGLYAVNTLDKNALLGEWPELRGYYSVNGFSGHGLQQAPAAGRYIAELILGAPHGLDLSVFSPARVLENRPIGEGGIV